MKKYQWTYLAIFVAIFTLFVGAAQAASVDIPDESYANSCPTILGTTLAPNVARKSAVGPEDILACIRSYEGGYTSVNPAGYYGAYQFTQGTWNSTASAAGRADLVGKNPAEVAPADQDAMAQALIARHGLSPWPTPNRMCQ